MRGKLGLFLTLFIGLSLLLDWYVFQAVKLLTAKLSAGWQRGLRGLYWLVALGPTLGLVYQFLTAGSSHTLNPTTQLFLNTFLTLFVTKLVLALVLLLEDLGRGLTALGRALGGNKKPARPLLPQRRTFVSQLALAVAAIPFGAFVYGVTKGKYDYRVHRRTLYFPDLPAAFDGFTIAQISDVHSGSFTDHDAVQRGIDLIKKQGADLFVFTGDLVNNVAEEIEPWIKHFRQLRAPFGQFSVLGNHDYGLYVPWTSPAAQEDNLDRLKGHHAELGYRLLLNEHVRLEKDGQHLALIGVENWGQGFIQKGDLDQALKGVAPDAFKILLSHDPSHWDEIVQHHPADIRLTLAGHTHGMQFGIETPTMRWSPVKYRYPHWADLARTTEAAQRYLYVNRGFGFIGFSGRVGIWPEITVLELRRGTPQA